MYSLFSRHISFSLFIQKIFETVHICASVHNTNPNEVFSDSHKYLTFVIHISFFTSMISLSIPYMALNYFANVNEVYPTIHKYFTSGSHIYSF